MLGRPRHKRGLLFFQGRVSVTLKVLKTPTGGHANPIAFGYFYALFLAGSVGKIVIVAGCGRIEYPQGE